MKIVSTPPPNYDQLRELFGPGVDINKGVIFTYGDTIHGINPSKDVIVHEMTHIVQQKKVGGPEIWWDKWINDIEFRADQELEAYRVQYQWFVKHNRDRNEQIRFLHLIGGHLASPIYGNIYGRGAAIRAIKKV